MSKVFCGWVAGQMKTILTCIDITFDLSLHRLKTFVKKKIIAVICTFILYKARSFFPAISCRGRGEG